MKKIKLAACIGIMLFSLVGCTSVNTASNSTTTSSKFQESSEFKIVKNLTPKSTNGSKQYIIRDTQTSIMYIVIYRGDSGVSITPLLDANGAPEVFVNK
jgi:hypothetical protein